MIPTRKPSIPSVVALKHDDDDDTIVVALPCSCSSTGSIDAVAASVADGGGGETWNQIDAKASLSLVGHALLLLFSTRIVLTE